MVEVWRRGGREARSAPPPTAPRGGISATQVSPEGEVEGSDGRGGETEQEIARRRARRSRAKFAVFAGGHAGEVGGGAHGDCVQQSLGVRPRAGKLNGKDGRPNQRERQDEVDGDQSHPSASCTTRHGGHLAVYGFARGRRRPDG